jgi:signal transduction histidine kinase
MPTNAQLAALESSGDDRISLLADGAALLSGAGDRAPAVLARLLVERVGEGCSIDQLDRDVVLAGDASLPCRLTLSLSPAATLRLFRRAPLERGWQVVVIELATRVGWELELARLRREADEAAGSFRELLRAGSHEVRTPLSALKLQLQGLERQLQREVPDVASLEARLGRCCLQLERVEEGIERLLDAGLPRRPREPEPVDLAQLALDVAVKFSKPLKRAGCALTVRVSARPVGDWDAEGLERAVTALLDHARKHGAGRPIEMAVSDEGASARLSITDGGPPLAADELAELFSPLGRATWQRHFGSTGLAVERCRDEIGAMGGRFTLESGPKRTEYALELPL